MKPNVKFWIWMIKDNKELAKVYNHQLKQFKKLGYRTATKEEIAQFKHTYK